MKLDLTKKVVGPVPLWAVLMLGIDGAWAGYKYYKGRTGPNGETNGTDGALSQPDSGKFTATNKVTGGDGSSAVQTSSGPLLTGASVGVPAGYPGYSQGGDVYVNLPGSPAQTTTQSASMQTYTVKTGDTLSKIAKRIFGTDSLWRDIYQVNLNSIGNDPGKLTAGTVLNIPTLSHSVIDDAQNQNTDDTNRRNKSRDDGNSRGNKRR